MNRETALINAIKQVYSLLGMATPERVTSELSLIRLEQALAVLHDVATKYDIDLPGRSEAGVTNAIAAAKKAARRIIIKQGDITEETTDAIVNPANSRLVHGGGAARAIAMKGGEEIVRQSNEIIRKIGHLPTTKAVITGAGNLPCKFVIHVVGPQMGEGDEDSKLKRAVWNVLTLAENYNLRTIAMPAISSGIFGFPKPRCAEVLLSTAARFLDGCAVSLQQIVMCNHDEETYRIFLHTAVRLKLLEASES
ncbi:macro domain-containing protein [Sporolituus thermophilus]|uniref:O-acetyl-ADP-ribose deacetylase (Regulator of RNase III), contains Macro domain n=1 Tax=Sporolituus thermophilus DSM 23256 TaxID=1123285 RepID=A0A1G7JSN5_9FIRM|nr:macro domain-containing protein [Sporolituus thermophilus]SDF27881.1 O-acetyl-ADP-ribose deacetylase (regulator of RNase III), contains Macro domain [Sporolituus thermophilus DSM 23256]